MTATQLFLRFLRETCTVQEYKFFAYTIVNNNGNKYFKKRPLYKPNFVEGYLSRNNRHLRNFMTRLFILAPNLIKNKYNNPRWIKFLKHNRIKGYKTNGAYVNMYRWRWHDWLDKRIEIDNKKLQSPFKKGEQYNFKLKEIK